MLTTFAVTYKKVRGSALGRVSRYSLLRCLERREGIRFNEVHTLIGGQFLATWHPEKEAAMMKTRYTVYSNVELEAESESLCVFTKQDTMKPIVYSSPFYSLTVSKVFALPTYSSLHSRSVFDDLHIFASFFSRSSSQISPTTNFCSSRTSNNRQISQQ